MKSKRKRSSEKQIILILNRHEADRLMVDLAREWRHHREHLEPLEVQVWRAVQLEFGGTVRAAADQPVRQRLPALNGTSVVLVVLPIKARADLFFASKYLLDNY